MCGILHLTSGSGDFVLATYKYLHLQQALIDSAQRWRLLRPLLSSTRHSLESKDMSGCRDIPIRSPSSRRFLAGAAVRAHRVHGLLAGVWVRIWADDETRDASAVWSVAASSLLHFGGCRSERCRDGWLEDPASRSLKRSGECLS